MSHIRKLILCAVILYSFLCSGTTAQAIHYQATVIAAPSDGDEGAMATNISNTGLVFGSYGAGNTTGYFFWSREKGLSRLSTEANIEYWDGPNSAGRIVGDELFGDACSAIVREPDGSIRHLVPLNSTDTRTMAWSVADNNVVIGTSADQSATHIVTWDLTTGAVTQIAEGINGNMGGCMGSAAINSTGYMAWTYITTYQYPGSCGAIPRSYRRNPFGKIEELVSAETIYPEVLDAADDGTVLVNGKWLWNTDGTLTRRGLDGIISISDNGILFGVKGDDNVVLYPDGSVYDIPLPTGATDLFAWDINNRGEVVGRATFADGVKAVIWEPVPEPSSILTLLCSLCGLAGFIYRKRE